MSRISHPDQTTQQRRRLPSTTTTNASTSHSQSRIFQPLHLDPQTSSHSYQLPSPYEAGQAPESLFRRSRLTSNGGGERTPQTQSRRLSHTSQSHAGSKGSGFSRRSYSNNKDKGWESLSTAGGAGSESGMSGFSVLSAFPDPLEVRRRKREKRREKEARKLLEEEERGKGAKTSEEEEKGGGEDPTDSPLRRWVRWMLASTTNPWDRWKCLGVCLGMVLIVKWQVGLGGYSGMGTPPLRGDFEAQRHWISLTSSSLSSLSSLSIPFTRISIPLYHPPSTSQAIGVKEWYSHDLSYWGLDYPPLTAYHSLFLGLIARLSPSTARYVTLRPHSINSTKEDLGRWEDEMKRLEMEGGIKNFMRGTVIAGDLVLWVTAVGWYCWWNFGRSGSGSSREKGTGGISEKALRRTLVASLTILFQPALILIDNGHFQYNSLMLALTLWSINAFQSGHDLIGSVLFVASLGFKQMALYYAPGVFAYLLGKCLWLGGREGVNLFLHLGLTVALSFTLLFLPFLTPFPTSLFQALHRIFPFARGLFEDKVANFWCTLNIILKLRRLASVQTLARLSLILTGMAVLPSTAGVVWISYRLGQRSSSSSSSSAKIVSRPAPTSHLLPHLLLTSSLSFFLFSFQVHEKSILLPLMPLTLLMGAREKGYGRLDWEWGVLLNNVAVFSMFPLLKKDGLIVQYVALTLLWNFLIGYNPFKLRKNSFVKLLSLTAYSIILILHTLEFLTTPPPHLPDLFPVLNLTVSAGVFGLGWLWGGKRLAQESWAIGGF